VRRRFSRLLLAALACSLLTHLLIALAVPKSPALSPPEDVVISSAVRIEHLPQPRPHDSRLMPHQPRTAEQRPVRTARSAVRPRVVVDVPVLRPRAPVPMRHASPPTHATLPSVDFQKTIAELRRQNDPVVAAARPVSTPAAARSYKYDFSASVGSGNASGGILTPVRSWHDGGFIYYYVRYWVQYPDGTTETGIVPWPLRYRPQADPFQAGLSMHMPLPVPLPDFRLEQGTVLHPLVAYCYAHRDELDSCPIAHD
jgi:hypothetical protein